MYEYKVEDCSRSVLQDRLSLHAKDGWKVISVYPYSWKDSYRLAPEHLSYFYVDGATVIYERPVE